MRPITRETLSAAISEIGRSVDDGKPPENRAIPVSWPMVQPSSPAARAFMRMRGKSVARQVMAEIERQRAGGRTHYTAIDEAAVFTDDGKAFEYIATPPPVNYQSVPTGALLNPSFGPPRAMPLEPNLRPLVMCLRIALMQQGARLSWY